LALLLAIVGLPGATPRAAAQCGGTISSGQAIAGSIARAGSSCAYTFNGAAGSKVTIKMVATSSSLDPYLKLKNPSGKIIAQDDDSGGGSNSLINYSLSQAGTYTIVAGSYNNASSGSFNLRFDSSAASSTCGGSIAANTWVSGTIARNGQRCKYTFNGNAGETVSIAMRATSRTLDPYLELNDPGGKLVAKDDDSYGGSNSLISGYKLLQTGQYTIVARAYNDASYGSFEVYLERKR